MHLVHVSGLGRPRRSSDFQTLPQARQSVHPGRSWSFTCDTDARTSFSSSFCWRALRSKPVTTARSARRRRGRRTGNVAERRVRDLRQVKQQRRVRLVAAEVYRL